jgi:hypothetical protein
LQSLQSVEQRKVVICVQTSAHILVAMLDIKVDFVGDSWALCSINGLRAEKSRKGDNEESERQTGEHGGNGWRKAGYVSGRLWTID